MARHGADLGAVPGELGQVRRDGVGAAGSAARPARVHQPVNSAQFERYPRTVFGARAADVVVLGPTEEAFAELEHE
ncbi:hypothetical protein ACFQE5_09360 [Pseudonocardia hispaniensis]|uniref:Uncharacterized protein n=1 Tax=Pseudonocardia hispaniensis TaxID=904933 RepID=A0ABW1J121_9PSEU